MSPNSSNSAFDAHPVLDGFSIDIAQALEAQANAEKIVPVLSPVVFEGAADGHLYLSEEWIVEVCHFPGGYEGFQRFQSEVALPKYSLHGQHRYRLADLHCASDLLDAGTRNR